MVTVTVEEYMTGLLRRIENRYFAEIWNYWKVGRWEIVDAAERELVDQQFYDDLFQEVKTFLSRDLAKMLGDHLGRMSAGQIRYFVMARLLPVDGSTVVKFLKLIRCSWDRYGFPGFDRLGDRILSHTPKAADGLDGLDIGADYDTIRENLQKLVKTIYKHNQALMYYFFR